MRSGVGLVSQEARAGHRGGAFGGSLELAAPRTAIGRLWVSLLPKSKAARWVDDWWYERANIPSMAISMGTEVGIWAVGLLVTPLPAVFVIALARLSAVTNEFHTMYLAIRHHSLDLFNQPQTWERRTDGSIGRVPGFAVTRARRMAPTEPFIQRAVSAVRRHSSDLWTQRRRLPGFVIGIASPVLAFVMGTAFGFPVLVTTAITYATVVLQSAPLIRSGVLSLVHRSADYFNRPQLHAPGERHAWDVGVTGHALDGHAPTAPEPSIQTVEAAATVVSNAQDVMGRGARGVASAPTCPLPPPPPPPARLAAPPRHIAAPGPQRSVDL